MSKWWVQLPIWVSRKTADGFIAEFAVPLWLFTLVCALALLNALAWGFIGLYEAVKIVL